MKVFLKVYATLLQLVVGLNCAVEFYPFGRINGDSALQRADDAFTTVQIGFDFPFFGELFREVHISTNGIIFFGAGSTAYTPNPFPLYGTKCVAAYWTDSDPREGGDIFYREIFDEAILKDMTRKIQLTFLNQNDFQASWGLIVTYSNVSRYGCGGSSNYTCQAVVNHQSIIITNGYKSFVMFLYKKLDYTNGQIGFNAGDAKRFYLVANSNTWYINTTALTSSNVGLPGEWIFSIGQDIQSVCSTDGFMYINPRKVAYFGNEEIYIGGPCFNVNDTFVNVMIGNNVITCIVNNTLKMKCRLPYLNKVGNIEVFFKYNNLSYKSFLLVHNEHDSIFSSASVEVKEASLTDNAIIKWDKNLTYNQNIAMKGYELQVFFNEDHTVNKINKIPIEYLTVENSGQWTIPSNRIVKRSINSNALRYFLLTLRFTSAPIAVASAAVIAYHYSGQADRDCRAWHQKQPDNAEMERIKEQSAKQNPCQPSVSTNFPEILPNSFKQDGACNQKRFYNNYMCNFFHNGAKSCYRSSNNAATRGVATQCCYDANGQLILSPPGGGTLDFVDSEQDNLGHQIQDVLPYLQCCKLSKENLCDLYYEKRPIIDSSHWIPPRPVRASGDPHFTTMDGLEYDFNPIGEFVYLQTSDTEIQARISQFIDSIGQPMQASYFSAFAFRVKNTEVIQVTLNKFKTLTVSFDKTELNQGFWNLGNYTIDFTKNNSVKVQLVTDINVLINATAGILNIITIPSASLKGKISGLIGYYDDNINNDLMLRNGTFISINSTPQQIHNFGLSWATKETTSLFNYPEGLKWSDYQRPNFIPLFEAPSNDAVCGTDKNCQFDLYVTKNQQLAETNIIVKREIEMIQITNQIISETCNRRNVSNAHNAYSVSNDVHKYSFSCHDGYNLLGQNSSECYKGNYTGTLGSCYKIIELRPNSSSTKNFSLTLMVLAFLNIKF